MAKSKISDLLNEDNYFPEEILIKAGILKKSDSKKTKEVKKQPKKSTKKGGK